MEAIFRADVSHVVVFVRFFGFSPPSCYRDSTAPGGISEECAKRLAATAIRSKMSLTNEFMMLIAFELIPVSGWTCLRRFPCDGDDASCPSLRPCSLCRRLSFRLSCFRGSHFFDRLGPVSARMWIENVRALLLQT